MTIVVPAPGQTNHAPAGTDKAASAVEDQLYTVQVSDFGFSDPQDNPANNFFQVKIDSLPAVGTLSLNGSAITSGQLPLLVRADAIAQGKLTYQAPAQANGNALANITFQVQDDGGTPIAADTDPTANTLSFNVASVDDAPSGIDRTLTTFTSTTYTFQASDFNFDDPNDTPHNGLAAVIVTTLPQASQGSLTLNGAPVSATQVIPASSITSGLFKFTPAVGVAGNNAASFTFQVQDDGGTANGGVDTDAQANTMTFNVIPPTPPVGRRRPGQHGHGIEDVTYAFKTTDFPFTDAKPATTSAASRSARCPARSGTIKLNGNPVAQAS